VIGLAWLLPAWLVGAPAGTPLLNVEARLEPSGEGRGTLEVQARVAQGWHVNSHSPSEDYLIPTAVRLEPASGVAFEEARYPDGVLRKFAFSQTPLSVYEERFTVVVPVAWTAGGLLDSLRITLPCTSRISSFTSSFGLDWK